MLGEVAQRVRKAKLQMYGDSAEWGRVGYGAEGRVYSEAASAASVAPGIPSFHCSDLSPARFKAEFAARGRCVLITGLTERWAASKTWRTDALYESAAHIDTRIPVGTDDEGNNVMLDLEAST